MSNSTPNQSFTGPHGVIDLLDPRSPTTAFQRTPIMILHQAQDANMSVDENTCEILNDNDVNSVEAVNDLGLDLEEDRNTSSSSTSFLSATMEVEEANLTSCDPSPVVSDFNVSETLEKEPEIDQETAVETPKTIEPVSDSIVLSSEKSCIETVTPDDSFADIQLEIKNPAKKLFYTPNKKRVPLVAVDNICPVTPPVSLPQNVLRQKQWKRIQEERKKLGLESDENVPLPLNDITASAPSKLMLRKNRLRSRYDMSS
ncbi:uncharacterized protein LOC135833371 [Planococcus citri]|uniref:uncharacterized protein LOC135833371 n=1 Tax=Planococcus citri TaxID=170843 RepID=UPI0031F9E3BF